MGPLTKKGGRKRSDSLKTPTADLKNSLNSHSYLQKMSESETDESSERSAPGNGVESCGEMEEDGVNEYEKQRLLRIRENKAKMDALGLPKLSSAVLGSALRQRKGVEEGKKKGVAKVKEEDDEYRPPDGEEGHSSSSEEDEAEDRAAHGLRRGSNRKGKKISPVRTSKAKKSLLVNRDAKESDLVDDAAALQQAIALSLEALLDKPHKIEDNVSRQQRKETIDIPEGTRGRKRRKSNISRVQMSEDEVIVYFFSIDEAGKGNITLRDLKKVANAHDFDWTEKELADMIDCFDNDRDGKLSLDDFRAVVARCNMIQGAGNA